MNEATTKAIIVASILVNGGRSVRWMGRRLVADASYNG